MGTIRRVLIVEDDDEVREPLVEIVRSMGLDTWEASDGARALELIAEIPPPCLILLDLMMPGTSGWAVLRALEATASFEDFPVILISAATRDLPENVPILRKPFDGERIRRIVAANCGLDREPS